MNDTLSQLMSSVYNSIGQPSDEILSRVELATIMFRRMSYRMEAVRNSEQGEQMCGTPIEFTLSSNDDEVILTDLVDDFVIPLWAEYKSWSNMGNDVWVFLPTVNLSMLAQQRNLGRYACSFYGSNAREVKFKSSLFGNEVPLVTIAPATIHVYYSQDIPFPSNEADTIDLPNNLINMVGYDSIVSALPLMITNASKLLKDMPEYAAQITAWTGLYSHMEKERAEFEHQFELWRRSSRGAHRPRSRPDVLSSRLGRGNSFMGLINNGGT